jgi:CO/xanthine dehydrogenase Mo-binding subunit
MRQAAAEARSILFILASEHLKVPVDKLEVTKGVIFVKNNPDKKVS